MCESKILGAKGLSLDCTAFAALAVPKPSILFSLRSQVALRGLQHPVYSLSHAAVDHSGSTLQSSTGLVLTKMRKRPVIFCHWALGIDLKAIYIYLYFMSPISEILRL